MPDTAGKMKQHRFIQDQRECNIQLATICNTISIIVCVLEVAMVFLPHAKFKMLTVLPLLTVTSVAVNVKSCQHTVCLVLVLLQASSCIALLHVLPLFRLKCHRDCLATPGMRKAALLEDARQCIVGRPALQKRFLSGTLSRTDVLNLAAAMNAAPGMITRDCRNIRSIPNTIPVSEVPEVLNGIVGSSLEENDIIQLWESVEATAKAAKAAKADKAAKAAKAKDIPTETKRISFMYVAWVKL